MARLTDGNRPLALVTIDIGVSVDAARNERVVRKPCASVPYLFLFWGRLGIEGIISYLRLIRYQYHRDSVCESISTYHKVDRVVLEISQ